MPRTKYFQTFAVLPGVEEGIKGFREKLLALETQLNGIPPGDGTSWHRAWPLVKLRMQDLGLAAAKLDNQAEDLHASLIRELRDSASLHS